MSRMTDVYFERVVSNPELWRETQRSDLIAEARRAREREAKLEKALREIAKGGTRPCDDEPASARIAAAALAHGERRVGKEKP